MPSDDGPVYVDDVHQRITEFADDLLDEDEREAFVDHLMERRGYTRIQGWGPPSGDELGGQDLDDGGQDLDDGRSRPGARRTSTGGRGGQGTGSRGRRQPYFKR